SADSGLSGPAQKIPAVGRRYHARQIVVAGTAKYSLPLFGSVVVDLYQPKVGLAERCQGLAAADIRGRAASSKIAAVSAGKDRTQQIRTRAAIIRIPLLTALSINFDQPKIVIAVIRRGLGLAPAAISVATQQVTPVRDRRDRSQVIQAGTGIGSIPLSEDLYFQRNRVGKNGRKEVGGADDNRA